MSQRRQVLTLALFSAFGVACSLDHDCPPRLALAWGLSVCPDGANDRVAINLPGKTYTLPCTISPSPHVDSSPWIGMRITLTAQIVAPSGSILRSTTVDADVFRSTPDDTGGCTNPLVLLEFPTGTPDAGASDAN